MMASTPIHSRSLSEHLAAATAALALVAAPALAHAQTTPAAPAAPALQTVAYSSSSSGQNPYAGQDIDGSSLASAPDGSLHADPQYGGGYGGGRYHRYDNNGGWSHFAFEAGGGFTAPIGNDVNGGFTSIVGDGYNHGTETWGGNFLVGAGWNFTKRFALLGEYSWNTNKIPGSTLSAVYNSDPSFYQAGITQLGGNVHTQGITAEGVYYYYNSNRHSYAGYVIGGGGFYHKSTNFTTPIESCGISYYGEYCGYYNETVSDFTDNAGGVNLGTGISFKPFGEYSRAKLFAEARYTFVDTPGAAANSSNPHDGSEEIIPVTVGIRF